MSFTITTNDDKDKVHTVYNHPIAGLAIKDDGKMYVAIATNFTDCAKYKYEETNYNSEYMDYTFRWAIRHYQRGGNNDNQEFMWSANFTDSIRYESNVAQQMNQNITYEKVDSQRQHVTARWIIQKNVVQHAGCSIVKADSKKATDAKATGHHYIKAHESLLYTKR